MQVAESLRDAEKLGTSLSKVVVLACELNPSYGNKLHSLAVKVPSVLFTFWLCKLSYADMNPGR